MCNLGPGLPNLWLWINKGRLAFVRAQSCIQSLGGQKTWQDEGREEGSPGTHVNHQTLKNKFQHRVGRPASFEELGEILLLDKISFPSVAKGTSFDLRFYSQSFKQTSRTQQECMYEFMYECMYVTPVWVCVSGSEGSGHILSLYFIFFLNLSIVLAEGIIVNS